MNALHHISRAAVRALRLIFLVFLSVPGAGLALVAWSCGSDAPEAAEAARVVASPAQAETARLSPLSLPSIERPPAAPTPAEPTTSPPESEPAGALPEPTAVVRLRAEPSPKPASAPRAVLEPRDAERPGPDRRGAEVGEPAPSELRLVDSALATTVEEREPMGIAREFVAGEDQVWAWVKLDNPGEPTMVTFVWRHEGSPRGSATLEVGRSPSWRTWARKRTRASDAGAWTVEILDEHGRSLGTMAFEVEPGARPMVGG